MPDCYDCLMRSCRVEVLGINSVNSTLVASSCSILLMSLTNISRRDGTLEDQYISSVSPHRPAFYCPRDDMFSAPINHDVDFYWIGYLY